ncbi:toxic anion resistance protein [Paenibacillus athensensis]|uniref:Tellurium resistance protein n=1 Tax=Paenibacillus athensensis TaxID=1967502 RepID=A0A4Y8PWL0_9BACL|nr:toxic anion resistance protein [Paenibacillus athensensis]MCD1261480.1 toxic anion resistance protein [Paenibacillus athensensis]
MSTQSVALKQEDQQKVVQEASAIIRKVSQSDTLTLDSLMDDIGKLGAKTQEKAGQTLKQLERPVNELMVGKANQLSSLILDLRNECEDLQKSKNVSLFGKLVRKTPLKNYIYKYQSVKTNVDAIVAGLRDGKDTLEEDMASMRTLKRSALEEIYALQYKISLGQQLQELFDREIANPENEARKAYLERGQRKVVSRILSMTEDIMLYNQAIAATDIINDTNDKLIDAVNNSIYKAANLITVSAMITMAIDNQMAIASAVEKNNQTIEEQFKRNAELLKTSSQKSGELVQKTAMSLESATQAINDLMQALDNAEKSNREIIASCKASTEKFAALNNAMSQKLGLESGKPSPAIQAAASSGEFDRILN